MLDEWVVGLTRLDGGATAERVCWDDRGETASTLADAATRVRSFAFREAEVVPTRLDAEALMRVELQGRSYCVAVDQHWPASVEAATASASDWLEAAQARAREAASQGEIAVAAVFVTPRMKTAIAEDRRSELAGALIGASRKLQCSGCAFSFRHSGELAKYRFGDAHHPGALLIVQQEA